MDYSPNGQLEHGKATKTDLILNIEIFRTH
jgi:hypothetical protein